MFIERCIEDISSADSVAIDANSVNKAEYSAAIDDDLTYWAEMNREAGRARAAAAGAERGAFLNACSVAGMGLESLTDSDLVGHITELVAQRSRVEAQYLAAVGELVSREGAKSAAWQLREYARMNAAQARSEACLAGAFAEYELGDTFDALASGDIQVSHARLVAREAPKQHSLDEGDLLELCGQYPSDTIARRALGHRRQQAFAELQAQADGGELDPADAELALQRLDRHCSLYLDDDGMWHLRADFDFLAGRQVSMQLAAAERAVRQRDDSADDTFGQRNADALCDLISGRQRPGASLVIAADYDVITGRLANPRLDDGRPLSANQLAELAADAKILPAIFSSDWSELALGRVRSASEAQRIALAIRDGGCIACATHSERCHAHHIDHYEDGGLTEIPNLATLCEPCHIDHHQRHWPIETPPDGRPRRAPPPNDPARHHPAARSVEQHPTNITPPSTAVPISSHRAGTQPDYLDPST